MWFNLLHLDLRLLADAFMQSDLQRAFHYIMGLTYRFIEFPEYSFL